MEAPCAYTPIACVGSAANGFTTFHVGDELFEISNVTSPLAHSLISPELSIKFGATVEDLKDLELCYAPPFGTAKDVVKITV